ncbi:hypothetical protein DHW03_01595 [Pedobacter yonginense]|uniref:Uncharacterized protein n=1 Tax=Pedobacter yonginense TaxID=651869 RepID=A0A317ERU9_9SPHI|nr:hypothetical protein [Pedobacter yonginense]PWS28573.1 hypothetical protein DHW03_01595 [Pedobacter yonginense]
MRLSKNYLVSLFFVLIIPAVILYACDADGDSTSGNNGEQGCPVENKTPGTIAQGTNLNLYIETSGSMAGFMDHRGTAFQKEVWAVTEALDSRFSNQMGIYQIQSKSEKISPLKLDVFRNNLNTGRFVSAKSTDIPEMIDSIFNKAGKNTVSVLISDLIFSPDNGNAAQIIQITTDIKKRFYNKGVSGILLQLSSEFYKKTKVEGSPYYIWIIGDNNAANAVSKLIKSVLEGSVNEAGFGITLATPNYSILPSHSAVNNASPLICDQDKNYYSYIEYDEDEGEEITFWVGLNLKDLPAYMRSDSYLKNNTELTTDGGTVKLLAVSEPDAIQNAEDKQIIARNQLTHFLQLRITQPASRTSVYINIRKSRPDWIDELNLLTEDNLRQKTFGLKKMADGLESAYLTSQSKPLFQKPASVYILKK